MVSLNFLLLVAVTACTVKVSLQGPNQVRLHSSLMRNYHPLIRPVMDESDTLIVDFGLTLKQILDVDEKNQVLTANIWIQMMWNDYFLQWNEAEFPGVTSVHFPARLLWTPDILIENSPDERFEVGFHTKILVNNSGSAFALNPGIFKSTCNIDVRWFPFDVQRCKLKFISWPYDGRLVDLKMVEGDFSRFSYTINEEWELVEVTGKKNEIVYDCCPETYPDITYTIVIRRRTLYYGLNLLIPCVLISILALLVFLLPADSGEKVSLGITVLLSLLVLMLIVAQIIPATSHSVPVIALYFATMMVIVGLSVIASVVILKFHRDPDGGKMSKWTRIFLLSWCARFLCMKRPREDRERPSGNDEAPWSSQTGLELNPSNSVPQSTSGSRDNFLPKGQTTSLEAQLARILDEVRCIAKKLCDQDEDKIVRSEWEFAVPVIDRICLVAFSLVTILYTVKILMLVCFNATS